MDELYRFQYSSISCPDGDSNFLGDGSNNNSIVHHQLVLTADQETHEVGTGLEMPGLIKAQIANHPLYPNLVAAYVECRKVGAPPEMASLLEEISKENQPISTCSVEIGTDPELDDFMKSYCEVLHKYKKELSKPFDEATNFLSSIESQLTDLCKETLPSTTYSYYSVVAGLYWTDAIHVKEDGGGPSGKDMSCGEVEGASGSRQGGEELKEMLMRKYRGYLSTLGKEFLKKRKKGKLPKDARTALLDWWNTHYRWPYPTEEEKNRLSEVTGLDQKQINNWFINQRKRHWRPSEDMRFALMEGVSGGINEGSLYFDDATGGTRGLGT